MSTARGSRYLARTKRNGIWQIDFTIGGQRIRESSGTADKAQASTLALARHTAEWNRHHGIAQPASGATRRAMTIGEACGRYSQEILAHGSRSDETAHLSVLCKRLGAVLPLSSVTNATVASLVSGMLGSGLSPATVNRYITTLGKLCHRAAEVWEADVGRWDRQHHRQAEPPGRQTYLTSEQAGALLDACCGHLRPIVYLVLSTGLRRDNAVLLTWDQVSLDMRRIVVTQKGRRPLGVDLTDGALDMLTGLPGVREGAVFRYGAVPCACKACSTHNLRGQAITSIRRPFAAAIRACGLDDLQNDDGRLHVHDLRHTFASALHAETGDLLLVRDALGHSSVKSTQRYAHLAAGRRRAEVNRAMAEFLSPDRRNQQGEVA
jgi:integrase